MIALIAAALVISAGLLLSPVCRPWWREILLGLRAGLIETPLRAITGRKRMTEADYRRLRKLEIECELVEPPTVSDRAEDLEKLLDDPGRMRGVLARGEFPGLVRSYQEIADARHAEALLAVHDTFSGIAAYWTEEGTRNDAQGQ